MPVINLEINGKQAISDGTKIVCMNGDYVVNIRCINCAVFTAMPVKKLILKAGLDYYESPITSVTEGSKTYWRAELPTFGYHKVVELGVYGKESESGDPKYTSIPAIFECVKSILCGAVVLKKDPTLNSLDVKENGTYTAADRNVDGFYEVHVAVPAPHSETRYVELSMAGGSQVIEPTSNDRAMSQVVVTKPLALTPSNIKAGITIGGVVGAYDKILTETEVFKDGEYLPPQGYDGFSKVTVRISGSNYNKLLRVGEYFEYKYDHSVSVTMDTPGVVKYENSGEAIIFTAIAKGSCSIVVRDFDKDSNLVSTVHYAIVSELESEQLLPREANTLDMLDVYLSECVPGSIIKYTGPTTGSFIKNALYIVQEGE